MRIKTHLVEPLIEAVLIYCFTAAAAPHVKDEYNLIVNAGCKVTDGKISEWIFVFEIEIPRLDVSLKDRFVYSVNKSFVGQNHSFLQLLDDAAYLFAATIYSKIGSDAPALGSLNYERAKEILRPILDKLEPTVYANFIPPQNPPKGVVTI